MEGMTKEEAKSYRKVLENISEPTGNNFFDTGKNKELMTDSQKAECKKLNYMNYHCNRNCEECTYHYQYVLGCKDGYKDGYKDSYDDWNEPFC